MFPEISLPVLSQQMTRFLWLGFGVGLVPVLRGMPLPVMLRQILRRKYLGRKEPVENCALVLDAGADHLLIYVLTDLSQERLFE